MWWVCDPIMKLSGWTAPPPPDPPLTLININLMKLCSLGLCPDVAYIFCPCNKNIILRSLKLYLLNQNFNMPDSNETINQNRVAIYIVYTRIVFTIWWLVSIAGIFLSGGGARGALPPLNFDNPKRSKMLYVTCGTIIRRVYIVVAARCKSSVIDLIFFGCVVRYLDLWATRRIEKGPQCGPFN